MKQKAKHLSILLAFSLILSSIPGTNASAAKKVSVIAGKTKKIELKNNKKKVTWKVIKGKNIIEIKKKTKTYATIEGVKKGSAEVQAKIGKKKYTCKVTVKEKATTEPTGTPTEAPSTEPTLTPSTEPTGMPTETSSTEPTETPGQDEVLTLYYNDENAGEVVTQIRYSKLPVHVIVESSVTSIGDYAFVGCDSLASIMWNGNTYIGVNAFLTAFEKSKENTN